MIKKELAHRMIDELFEVRETMKAMFIPKEANQHFLNARKEGLLGIQALVSHLITEMDDDQFKQKENQVKKIKVEE
jgi:hypothetical protein